MKYEIMKYLETFVVTVLFLSIVIGAVVGHSYFEAKAFNRATGQQVTTWDAVWIQLRVQAAPMQIKEE